jgi:ribosomal protein L4
MNHEINYMIAQQRAVELQLAAAQSRLARDVHVGQHTLGRSKPIARMGRRLARLSGRLAPSQTQTGGQ